jgi:hypothetical protein
VGINRPAPKLDPGEVQVWSRVANHVQGAKAAGGTLVVTDRRIVFEPSRIDKLTGAERWSCPRGAVSAVEAIDKDLLTPSAGGLRRRLGLRVNDWQAVFVVNKLDATMQELSALLGVPIAQPPGGR